MQRLLLEMGNSIKFYSSKPIVEFTAYSHSDNIYDLYVDKILAFKSISKEELNIIRKIAEK